jgi:hypothetical protein
MITMQGGVFGAHAPSTAVVEALEAMWAGIPASSEPVVVG